MDPIYVVGGFGVFGLAFGLCLVGYAIITRWPTSPRHLQDQIEQVAGAMVQLRTEWHTQVETMDELLDRVENKRNRAESAARRREKANQQAEEPQDPMAAQMAQLGPGGVMSRFGGRH